MFRGTSKLAASFRYLYSKDGAVTLTTHSNQSTQNEPSSHRSVAIKCRSVVFAYAPDARENIEVPIGVVLLQEEISDLRYLGARFTENWERVASICPNADLDLLRQLAAEIEARFVQVKDTESLLADLQGSLSNCLRIAATEEILTPDPKAELDALVTRHLKPRGEARSDS